MAQYAATTANNNPVIVNVDTGAIVKIRTNVRGRRIVRLYYNGKSHTHTLAHAWYYIANGLNLIECKSLDVHHIDGNRLNDTAKNWAGMCKQIHKELHKTLR